MTPANEKQARGRLTHLDDLLFIYCGESGSLAVQALRDNEPRVLIPFLCGESGSLAMQALRDNEPLGSHPAPKRRERDSNPR